MNAFILTASASEITYLLRAETEAAHGQPELNTTCEKDYIIDEDFDHRAYGIRPEERCDLVTSIATLTIEPRRESGYWVLSVIVERAFGLVSTSEEDDMTPAKLTLDEFDLELRSVGQKKLTVRVDTQTPAVKQNFDDWLADMRARHPWKVKVDTTESDAVAGARQVDLDQLSSPSKMTYRLREAVGIFPDPDTLGAVVDELEISGFDRAAISVLAIDVKARKRLDQFYRAIEGVEDNRHPLQSPFASRQTRTESKALAIGAPLYIGGVAGAGAIAAVGSTLALAVAAVIVLGLGGVSLGPLLAAVVARRYSARAQEQLRKGGLILWIDTPTPEAEKRATVVLERMNARDVHIHEIYREWSIKNIPLAGTQPDPFGGNARNRDP